MKKLYLIGSLRNPRIREFSCVIRDWGYDVFDDWHAAGPEADDIWQEYEVERGHDFQEALGGAHAQCVFDFDKKHLDESDLAVLVMPAGKSCFLELGYMVGSGKPGYIFYPDGYPNKERYDVMFRFATKVCLSMEELKEELCK